LFLLFLNVFFQLPDLPVKPNKVDDNASKNGCDYSYDHPDFTVGAEPVGHFDAIGYRLLGHQVLAEEK